MNLLTLEEAAKELGLTYGTISQYVFYGKLKAKKVGHRRMIERAELERFELKRKGEL
jgi:excisionase family DNA binding protein